MSFTSYSFKEELPYFPKLVNLENIRNNNHVGYFGLPVLQIPKWNLDRIF